MHHISNLELQRTIQEELERERTASLVFLKVSGYIKINGKRINLNESLHQRFWSKVNKTASCWIWLAKRDSSGYGWFGIGSKMFSAHRVAYTLTFGSIREGMTLDHVCRNPSCVNPDHCEQVTLEENVLRGQSVPAKNARKTHCKHGHEFTASNTYLTKEGRHCLTCRAINIRKWWARKKVLQTT